MKQNKNQYLITFTLACIFTVSFFLPIKTSISNIGLIGLVCSTLLSFGFSGFEKRGKLIYFFLFSPMIFFIPLIWGWIYSSFPIQAFQEISKYIFLGLTPLFLFRKDISVKEFRKYAASGLLSGVVISGFFLIIITLYKYSQTEYPIHWLLNYNFTSFNFIEPLKDMHPIYMGMYYALGLAILLFAKLKISILSKSLSFIIITISIVFLASRIIYGITFLLVLLYLIDNLTFKTFAVIITGGIIGLALGYNMLEKTYVFHKTINGTLWDLKENVGTYNTDKSIRADSRLSRWLVAAEAIFERPILGYGGGAENEVLLEKYKFYKMDNSVDRKYNAHNQFLGFLLRFGILAGVLMLVYFIKNGVTAFRHQNLLFLSFLTILFWCFMIENILDRNMGINYVALFGTLFYAEYLSAKKIEEKLS